MPPPSEGADGFDAMRALGVLQEVAKRAGWDKRASLPKGRGMGTAWQYSHRGYFAEVADVTVDGQNRVKVNKRANLKSQVPNSKSQIPIRHWELGFGAGARADLDRTKLVTRLRSTT